MTDNDVVQSPKKRKTDNGHAYDALANMTVIVCDTGEINAIKKFTPTDATTNPSLLLKAAIMPEYEKYLKDAIGNDNNRIWSYRLINHTFIHLFIYLLQQLLLEYSKSYPKDDRLGIVLDKFGVNIGAEILKVVPGYVSTEIDARLSFNTDATVDRARRVINMYKEIGIDKSRILIKVASTYEGIKAGEILEKEGIQCNLTLLFSLIQAAACAEANITLISPFVGRILDWHKAKTGKTFTAEEDPGVLSVRQIFNYYKKFGYKTIVMGASFRNTGEILALAGCDRLTIAPSLLEELQALPSSDVKQILNKNETNKYDGEKLSVDESNFRYQLNEDAMATEKLAEGIRSFAADIIKLENMIIPNL